jgi:UDP-glucose 4-epimerase
MAKVLVTGGTGQVGAHVCKELLQSGHEVAVYDSKPNPENISDIASKVDIVTGDVTDFDELVGVMKKKGVTHVIHLAALIVLESKQRPADALTVNCVGTNNIFEGARLMNLQRVVYASSVAVYGEPDPYPSLLVNEDDFPQCPADPYSVTKFLNEMYGKYYQEAYGLDLLCFRITAAWGPGRYSGYTGQFNAFVKDAATEKAATFPEDFAFKDSRLRWMYVKDTARAFAHSINLQRRTIKRGLYNVGSRKAFKAADVIGKLKSLLPKSEIHFHETNKPTKVSRAVAGPSGLEVDCSRLYRELAFEEKFGLGNGLKDMVNHERLKAGLPTI